MKMLRVRDEYHQMVLEMALLDGRRIDRTLERIIEAAWKARHWDESESMQQVNQHVPLITFPTITPDAHLDDKGE